MKRRNRPCGTFHHGRASQRTVHQEIRDLKQSTGIIQPNPFNHGAICALKWCMGHSRVKPSKMKEIVLGNF